MKSKIITCKRSDTKDQLEAASAEGWELVAVIPVDGFRELYFRWPVPMQVRSNPIEELLHGPFGGVPR